MGQSVSNHLGLGWVDINLPTYRLKKEWINVAIKLDCIKHELTIHVVLANCQNFVEGVKQLMFLLR